MTRKTQRNAFLDWKAIAGLLLGAALLAFSLRGVDLGAVLAEIRRADPWLFLASIAFATAPILVRAWRWKSLLEPVRKDTSFQARFRATAIGFMANNVLPARIGEFARAYAFSKMEPVPVVASVASLVVERLFDGVVVVTLLLVPMAMPGFPAVESLGRQDPRAAATTMIAILGAILLVALAMVLRPRAVLRVSETVSNRVLPARFRAPVLRALEGFVGGLGSLRDPLVLARAGFWSIWVWMSMAFAFWLGFLAFDIHVPFAAAMFLQSLIALAVALPSAPGFFGLWEAAARIGLVDIWGVELDKALGFAIGFHLGGFLSVTLLGLYFAWRLGLSLGEMGQGEGDVAGDDVRPTHERPGERV